DSRTGWCGTGPRTAGHRHCRGRAAGHRGPRGTRQRIAGARRAGAAATSTSGSVRPCAHADHILARAGEPLPRADARRAWAGGGHVDRGPRRGALPRACDGRSIEMSTVDTAVARKDLACTARATAFQKAFGAELRERVVERGEPFAIAQADTPHEIFHAMDIPVVSNQWWSAYISAKRLGGRYFEVLDNLGFPSNRCSYCSLGLACTLANDPATAPWGGMPRPTVLVARLTCDCIQQVFTQWAAALDSEFFPMEAPAWEQSLPGWYRHSRDRWTEVYGAGRIALMAAEMQALIALLERRTGRQFEMARLEALMERINEQERYLAEAAELVGSARPCPVSIVDQMPNTMIPQWHRGADWAVEHARQFRDEVRERVRAGQGVAQHERLRLMWIGAGLWHDTSFYQALESRLGAVFVWSMY